MSFKRRSGQYVFSCGHVDCGAEFGVHAVSYTAAWKAAKSNGWIAWKRGPVWMHFCSWIHRSGYERSLKEKAAKLEMPDHVKAVSAIERGELVKGVDF